MYQSFKKKSTPSPYFEDIVFEQDIKEPELHWQERKMLSTLDRWHKLKEFDVQPPDALRLRETPKTIARALGFTKFKLPIPQQHHLAFTYMSNPEANPGPQYKAKGYQTKQQGYDRAIVEAARVYQELKDGKWPGDILWGTAQRDKIVDLRNELDGERKLARLVLMPDMHESILGGAIAQPI
ncbi:hypothetical protein BDB00DRAFT_786037 [Zychaea mexicana]|uniref:uncharacterized protein n=1 Tax=Zychaea mexicana TaxID=64656 RepID=UPI0022FEE2F4|nr:uncharacterized protein BDB00DRAFT_786037 [Zychaea mexicana]KAI9495798.1 hypothetical protein BDB00DRAFT_786037 [Zychaea mexicana]